MHRLKRYLSRMVLFLAAVLVVVGVLHQRLLASFQDNPGLSALILAVFLFGLVYIFRKLLMLRREIDWLAAWSEGNAAAVPEPNLLAPMALMLGERSNRRLTLSATATRTLLDGVAARLDESRETARYFIALMIFLGLLGTFWGLQHTVHSIAAVIGDMKMSGRDLAGAWSSLQTSLTAPLSGMGTAFSASLFGLAGSLVLGFLDLQANQGQNRFFMDLEEWLSSATRLAETGGGKSDVTGPNPAYLAALVEQTTENIDILRQSVAQNEEQTRMLNANLLTLAEGLASLSDQMRTEQQLMIRIAETQMDLKPALERMANFAGIDRDYAHDDLTRQHIRNIDAAIPRLIDELSAGRERMTADLRSEIKLLTRTISGMIETEE